MALITGTSGSNTLQGTTGSDTLEGYAGNDWLDGNSGADLVVGGSGADIFIWNEDRNAPRRMLDIYQGSDLAENYDSNIYGPLTGGDKLVLGATAGGGGFRVFFTDTETGAAVDAFGNRVNFSGIERFEAGAGNDYIDGIKATVRPAHGSGGADYVPEHGLTLLGGGGNDTIRGSNTVDVLDGGEGDDKILGGGGNDLLMSSAGNDYGNGGDGDDNIRWGNNGGTAPIYDIGHDTLIGGNGNDLLNMWGKGDGLNSVGTVVTFYTASSGYATFARDNGSVRFSQFEQYWTHEGKDTVSAATANIGVDAGGINFNTRTGDDLLTGSNGRDTLEGGDQADTINGGRGDDIISMYEDIWRPDAGSVTPDAYRDVLILDDNFGTDRVRAFQVGDVSGRLGDRLSVSNLHDGQGNRVDVNDVTVSSSNGTAMLVFPNGERLILEGVSPSTLTQARLIEMGIPASTARAAAQSISTASATDNVYHDDSSALAASTGTHSGAASDTGRVLLGIYSSDVFATEATHTDSGSNHSHLSSAAEFMFG